MVLQRHDAGDYGVGRIVLAFSQAHDVDLGVLKDIGSECGCRG